MLLVVASLIKLIYSQKQRIIIPAATSLFLYATFHFLDYNKRSYDDFNSNDERWFTLVYTPCFGGDEGTQESDEDFTKIAYYSFLAFNASLIPILLMNRFNIIAIYYILLIADKILIQIRWGNFSCYLQEMSEIYEYDPKFLID